MKNKPDFTELDILGIISTIRMIFEQKEQDSEELREVKLLSCGSICILLILYFGESTAELIWLYATKSEKNQFESFKALYDFISDPYSSIISKNSALTLEQLRSLYPEEDMFKYFEKMIN